MPEGPRTAGTLRAGARAPSPRSAGRNGRSGAPDPSSLLRATIAIAVLVLAVATAPRLPLDYAANVSFPQVLVTLRLPPSAAADPTEVTTRWIVPIESAIRSLGDVVATRGQVAPDGGTLTVRFKSGTSPELKTARLSSELAPLRAKLPADAQMGVWPALQAGARPTLVVALTGSHAADLATRLGDELRTADGVRDVRIWGDRAREISVRLRRSVPAEITPRAVARAIFEQTRTRSIGTRMSGLAGAPWRRSQPLLSAIATSRFEDVVLRAGTMPLRLSAVADIRRGLAASETVSRLNGRPAVVLALYRDEDVPLFRFNGSVRRTIRDAMTNGVAAEEVWNEAAEVQSLLRTLALGLLLAMVVLAAFGWIASGWRGLVAAAYVPLAIALAVLLASAASMRVDAQAMTAVAIAVAGAAPIALRRRAAWMPALLFAGFALLLPIAITFGAGALAPFLRGPARAFLAGAVAAAAAVIILPRVPSDYRGGWSPRRMLRNSAGVLLAIGASVYLLLTWYGASLDPRASGRSPERTSLFAQVTLPRGATLSQTSAVVDSVERALRQNKKIQRFWSTISAGSATVSIDLQPSAASDDHTLLIEQLRGSMGLPSGVLTIAESFDRSVAMRMSEDVEERPETDEDATFYRVVLKSANIDSLQQGFDALSSRLLQHGVRRNAIAAEWGAATRRIELVPRDTTSTAAAAALAGQLAQQSLEPDSIELSDGALLRVAAADAPLSDDAVPQRDALLNMPLTTGSVTITPATAFTARGGFILGSVEREVGRFVLPVSIRVPGMTLESLPKQREALDASLATLPLPPDTTLVRPSLSPWHFSIEKVRLIGMAAIVPLLLFAAAVIVLNSPTRGLFALAPSAIAISCVAPLLRLTHGNVDESVLLAMAAALCCVTANSTLALARSHTIAAAYATFRDSAAPAVAAAVAGGCILLLPAISPAALRDGWRAPLVAASVVLIVGGGTGNLIVTALVLLEQEGRRRLSPQARAMRRPAAWSDVNALPRLSVRNVTKVYASGFRALHRISFDIEPGIIGLLGPNGAGKTTLLRILAGLLLPTRGQVLLHGVPVTPQNLADYRRLIGFLPQEFNAYAAFTAEQFLDYWAIERGISSPADRTELVENLLAAVDLSGATNRRVRDFSGGMRQRIGIARALIGDPPLLIVDEPTTGLDIEARSRFRGLMRAIARHRIVLLSTHIASDVEAAASRLLLLDHGILRYDGPTEVLIQRARGRVFEAVVSEAEARELTRMYRVTTRVRVVSGIRIRAVVPTGDPLGGAAVEPTLEEAYLAAVEHDNTRRVRAFAFLSELRDAKRAG
jgi:ABC-2 type transport system ATP-binding protein